MSFELLKISLLSFLKHAASYKRNFLFFSEPKFSEAEWIFLCCLKHLCSQIKGVVRNLKILRLFKLFSWYFCPCWVKPCLRICLSSSSLSNRWIAPRGWGHVVFGPPSKYTTHLSQTMPSRDPRLLKKACSARITSFSAVRPVLKVSVFSS